MTALRCISLHDPWGTACAVGLKGIETRGHKTNVRGRIGIHVAKKRITHCDKVGAIECYRQDVDRMLVRGVHSSLGRFSAAEGGTWIDVPYGCVVATANLVDCLEIVTYNSRRWAELATNGTPDYVSNDVANELLPANARGLFIHHRREDGSGYVLTSTNITAQLPYGDYRPGRFAWILDDVCPVTECCPACMDRPWDFDDCQECHGEQTVKPIPVKGRQGWFGVFLGC